MAVAWPHQVKFTLPGHLFRHLGFPEFPCRLECDNYSCFVVVIFVAYWFYIQVLRTVISFLKLSKVIHFWVECVYIGFKYHNLHAIKELCFVLNILTTCNSSLFFDYCYWEAYVLSSFGNRSVFPCKSQKSTYVCLSKITWLLIVFGYFTKTKAKINCTKQVFIYRIIVWQFKCHPQFSQKVWYYHLKYILSTSKRH